MTSILDLSVELVRHVVSFLPAHGPPTIRPHFDITPDASQPSLAATYALRATCRYLRDAIDLPPIALDVPARPAAGMQLVIDAPEATRQRVKWLRLTHAEGSWADFPPNDEARLFHKLLQCLPALETLVLDDSPFCCHPGLGGEDFVAYPDSLPPLDLALGCLAIQVQCRACNQYLTNHALCRSARTLKLTFNEYNDMYYDPSDDGSDAGDDFLRPILARTTVMERLLVKSVEYLDLEAAVATVAALCPDLRELAIATADGYGLPYIQNYGIVVDKARGQAQLVEADDNGLMLLDDAIFRHLGKLKHLEFADLGLHVRELPGPIFDAARERGRIDSGLVQMLEGLTEETPPAAAQLLVDACKTLRRGRLWMCCADPGYEEDPPYKRWSWRATDGRVEVDVDGAGFFDVALRNEDGAGPLVTMADEVRRGARLPAQTRPLAMLLRNHTRADEQDVFWDDFDDSTYDDYDWL